MRGPPQRVACCVGACPPQRLCLVSSCWPWVVVVCAACQLPLLGSGWWCFSRCHARLVLLVWRRLCRLRVRVFGWLWLAVGLLFWLRCLPCRGSCCAGAWSPSWWGLLRWCVVPHGRACFVGARTVPTVGRVVSVCGPPLGGACCAGAWPASWSEVLRCCVAPLMVRRALLLPARHRGCSWCGGA